MRGFTWVHAFFRNPSLFSLATQCSLFPLKKLYPREKPRQYWGRCISEAGRQLPSAQNTRISSFIFFLPVISVLQNPGAFLIVPHPSPTFWTWWVCLEAALRVRVQSSLADAEFNSRSKTCIGASAWQHPDLFMSVLCYLSSSAGWDCPRCPVWCGWLWAQPHGAGDPYTHGTAEPGTGSPSATCGVFARQPPRKTQPAGSHWNHSTKPLDLI